MAHRLLFSCNCTRIGRCIMLAAAVIVLSSCSMVLDMASDMLESASEQKAERKQALKEQQTKAFKENY